MNYMNATKYNKLQPLKKFADQIFGARNPEGASLEWMRRQCRKGNLRAVKVSSDWFTTREWIEEFNVKRIEVPIYSMDQRLGFAD